MQAAVRSTLLAGWVCACHSAPAAQPDGVAPPDGPNGGASGLHVTWASTPTIPGMASSNVTINSVLFRVDDLRVIGDAGSGDPRTSQESFELKWGASARPDEIVFGDAPTGVYSKVTLQADGHLIDNSYEITGSVRINDVMKDFEIHDRDALTANVDISVMLEPGGRANVPLRLRFDEALGVIDFTTLRVDDGKLELDTLDLQMPVFRTKLAASFYYDTSGLR
jgi:hypothetical protein